MLYLLRSSKILPPLGRVPSESADAVAAKANGLEGWLRSVFETGYSGGAKATSARGGAWLAYLAAGTVVAVACWLLLDGSTRALAFLVLGGVAAAAVLAGLRLNRPHSARPWYALLAGVALLVAGVPRQVKGLLPSLWRMSRRSRGAPAWRWRSP